MASGLEHCVRVRGASENNLRNVDVDIPRDAFVAFTGVSGSGKSSLAFGTLYAEAQRRYFESVAPYARRLLQQVGAPHVQEITGLPPAVALQQRRGAPSSRSTVGTITTLSNLLRMLYSRAGTYPPARRGWRPSRSRRTPSPARARAAHGLGVVHDVTEELLVPDPSLSIREGAIAAWPGAWQGANLRSIVSGLGIDIDRPWRKLRKKDRDWLLWTDEQPAVLIKPERDRIDYGYYGKFWSARKHVMHVLADSKSQRMRDRAMRFVRSVPCPECGGSGLRPEALAVTFAGHSIAEVNALPLTELAALLRPTAELARADAATPSAESGETTEVAVRHLRRPRRAHRGAARPRPRVPQPRTGPRRRCRRGRRSGCGSRPSCARGCSASSTCWTSRPRGCIRRTPSRCSTCCIASRRPATRCSSSSTTWTSYGERTGSSTSDPAPARPAAGCSTAVRSRTSSGRRVGHRRLPVRPRCAARARAAHTAGMAAPARRHAAQPARRLRRRAAVRADGGHRGVRLRQVDAGQPSARRSSALPPRTRRPTTRTTPSSRSTCRTRRRSRPSTDWCASTSDRSAARRGPTWRRTPGCSTRCASCTPRPTRRRARGYTAGRFSFNVAGGAVRDLPGRGLRRGRAAVPARHVCALPDLPRRALQRRDARGDLSRQEHRGRARDVGRRGRGVPRRRAAPPPAAWRRCARSGWATCGWASRRPSSAAVRRSASSSPPSCSGPGAATRSTCSTSRPRACTRPTSRCCCASCTGWSTPATPSSSSSTTST